MEEAVSLLVRGFGCHCVSFGPSPISVGRCKLFSVWSLHYGTWRWLSGQHGKSFCLQLEDKESNHKINFSAPLSPHFKKVWITNLCCLLPRECQVTSKAVMLSLLNLQTLQAAAPEFPSGVLNISGDDWPLSLIFVWLLVSSLCAIQRTALLIKSR